MESELRFRKTGKEIKQAIRIRVSLLEQRLADFEDLVAYDFEANLESE